MDSFQIKNISLGYKNNLIVQDLSFSIKSGELTTIIGPNGCGKSTILKGISRLMPIKQGDIYIKGKNMKDIPSKQLSKIMAVLPQGPVSPQGLTVSELVAYGRFPYQKGFGILQKEDKKIIQWALASTQMTTFQHRAMEQLSGGQRQRAWIAMALAQETDILILDEPTTYLDLVHQLDILQLLDELNKKQGTTIVMVLHELNLAARFSGKLIGIKDGKLVCQGTPYEVMCKENLNNLFSIDGEILEDPRTHRPVCITYDKVY